MVEYNETEQNGWEEETSRLFLDYGRYFVPERERQIEIISDLIPKSSTPTRILELACGAGLLAERILEEHPNLSVVGLDGSPLMLEHAAQRLARFGERFRSEKFDLLEYEWRQQPESYLAVVSSLAIHHLDDRQKSLLFQDVYRLLAPGGVFVMADIIAPSHPSGSAVAARLWDEQVLARSVEIEGTPAAFDFFQEERWNTFRYFDPEDIDKPSSLIDQLHWLDAAGFTNIDVFWLLAGHAVFGGWKPVERRFNHHLRLARPTRDFAEIRRFYCDGLGLEVLGSFHDHEGFDGLILGVPGQQYHLEFTSQRGAEPENTLRPEDLLVFYYSDPTDWQKACERIESCGFQPVISHNPYWDRKGKTYEDVDGCRVVLQISSWD